MMRRSSHHSDNSTSNQQQTASSLASKLGIRRAATPQPRRMSDLQTESMSIVESRELWAAFQSEARTNRISTAVGLREMLVDKHIQARRNSHESIPDKQGETRRKLSMKSLANAFDKEMEEDDVRLDSSNASFPEDDYRRAIRGKTNSVLSLYKNMDEANNNSHGDSIRRSLSDFTERWVTGTRNRESMDEESTVNSLRSSATLQLEDIFNTSEKSLEMYENSMKSLEDIANAASCHLLSKSEPVKLDNEEILSYLTVNLPSHEEEEEGSTKDDRKCNYEEAMALFDIHNLDESDYEEDNAKPFNVKTVRASKDEEVNANDSCDDSYDDRSNNGHFEFPIESKSRAELKRTSQASGQISIGELQHDRVPKRSSRFLSSDSSSIDASTFDPTAVDAWLSESIGSDLLVDWPSRVSRQRATVPSTKSTGAIKTVSSLFRDRPSFKACQLTATPSNAAKSTKKAQPISSMCHHGPRLCPSSNVPITSLSHQFMSLKYDLSPAKLPEKYLKRASISSLHDDLKPRPRSLSLPSDASVSTCPTAVSPPSDVSGLLVEWGDTAESDDEDDMKYRE